MTYNASNAATSLFFVFNTNCKSPHDAHDMLISNISFITPVASIITLKPFLLYKLLYTQPAPKYHSRNDIIKTEHMICSFFSLRGI